MKRILIDGMLLDASDLAPAEAGSLLGLLSRCKVERQIFKDLNDYCDSVFDRNQRKVISEKVSPTITMEQP